MTIISKAGLGLAIVGLGAAFLASPANAVGPNLVANGGFETGDFTNWTQSGNTGATYVGNSPNAPYAGSFAAELGPVGSDGFLTQYIATTVGDTYDISFYQARDGGTPNDFSVSFGGNTLFSEVNGPQHGYQLFSFSDVATSTSSALVFAFRQDPAYVGLDNVSVTDLGASAVPEPSAVAGMGVGVLGLAALSLRKRRVNA